MKKLLYIALLSILFTKARTLSLPFDYIHEDLNNNSNIEENITKNNNKENRRANYNTSLPYLDKESAHYFYGLTENYPKNYKGTCAFVAVSMLLQYYDTFWDDNIIPEVYEMNATSETSIDDITVSPGVKADSIPGYTDYEATQITNTNYYNIMMSMKDTHFQPYLFWIADQDDVLYLSMNSETSFASLNDLGRKLLVDTYLQEYRSYTASQYTFETVSWDDEGADDDYVREYTVTKLQLGIPVLLCMQFNGAVHAFIAYDYNVETDYIYGHYGDFECSFHFDVEEAYSYCFMSAQTLKFHTPHNHSNNYGLVGEDGETTYDCGCQLEIHNHKYTYITTGISYHRVTCFCGVDYITRHICTGTGNIRYCMYCNQKVDITQGPIISMGNNDEDDDEVQ